MAPQANRSTGFSRRAQYSTFFGYVAGVAGAIAGGALLVVAIQNPAAFSGARSAASDAVAPVAKASARGRIAQHGLIDTISGYFAAGAQNARLRREAEITRVKLVEAQALAEENRRLKALLGLMDAASKPVATARMISSTASSTRRFATISAGAREGVAVGMPVRSPMGLVGRILEVGRTTSRVLLITDAESLVPVRRATDGVPALATGKSDGTVQLRLLNLGINPLRKGDVFVTSGSGGLYHPNTAVAVVSTVTSDGAVGRLLSDPGATEFVTVDPAWAPATEPAAEQAGRQAGAPSAATSTAAANTSP